MPSSRLLPALHLMALLIPGLAAAPACAADAAAGRIQALVGTAKLYDAAGKERDIRQGGDIHAGDRIVTGDQSLVQMRLSDGSYVSVRMNTDVALVKYHHDANAPKESGIVLSLVRGALRSITGLIGSHNPGGYKIATPTATIGIRGTDHEPVFIPEPVPGEAPIGTPGTYDKVNSGYTILRGAGGEIGLAPGQVGFVPAAAPVAPTVLPKVPDFFRQLDPSKSKGAARDQGREPARDRSSPRAPGASRPDQGGDGGRSEADRPRSNDAAPGPIQLAPINLERGPHDGGRGESEPGRPVDAGPSALQHAPTDADRNKSGGRDDAATNRRNIVPVDGGNLSRAPAATDSAQPATTVPAAAPTATTPAPTNLSPTTVSAPAITTVAPAAITTVAPAAATIAPGRSSAVTLPATANPNAQKR